MKISSLLVAALALAVAACSSNPKSEEERLPDKERPTVFGDSRDPLAKRRDEQRLAKLDAEQLYNRARRELDSSDYQGAVESYDELSTRHPFSDFATQGELDRIYALYRNFEFDRALSSADRFLREHPRHPSVDYIHYVKGLANFSRDDSTFNFLPTDDTKADVTSLRRAFDDFALLLQRFPGSRYAGDSYTRMVFIRNRLAEHELHVVDFYVRRGAYVAAAKRAEQVVAQYPGTPSSYKALEVLVKCYELAGLTQQAEDARRLLAGQDPAAVVAMTGSPIPSDEVSSSRNPAETAPTGAAKPGLMARIAGFFSPLDSSKNPPKEYIIPAKKPEAPASGQSSTDPAAPASAEATVDAPGAAAAEPAATGSNKLEVFFEPYDGAPAKTPAPAKPAPAPSTSGSN